MAKIQTTIKSSPDSLRNSKSPRRQLLGYLAFPRKQIKYAYLQFLIVGISFSLVSIVAYLKYSRLASGSLDTYATTMLREYVVSLATMYLITMIVMGTFTFLVVIAVLHRFVGPINPLLRHLNSLLNDDFDQKTTLREGDELFELAEKLNQLSEKMKASR
jgi:nitrogen fixation/metabolism regulation signal transduction histidine kinase